MRVLAQAGYGVSILDDLSTGFRPFAGDFAFYEGRASDEKLVTRIVREQKTDAVMHFAARALVGESMADPLLYYERNVAETVRLLQTLRTCAVKTFVFSSSCATYGLVGDSPISEDLPQNPINPYGMSKLMVERILRDSVDAHGMRVAVLRYFNAAGADAGGGIGEAHEPETHLVPNAVRAAMGFGDAITVHGSDYPTPDGTCVRDYVHVSDLAQGHILALKKVQREGGFQHYNLGTGHGHSVLEVLSEIERTLGEGVPVQKGPRRPGDPPRLVANPAKAHRELGWKPRYSMKDIIETHGRWEKERNSK